MGDHYVSVSYLSSFSPNWQHLDDRKKNIWQYDKKTGGSKQLPIIKVAQSPGYYSFKRKDGSIDRSIENPILAEIDGNFKALLRRLKHKSPLYLEKDAIIEFFSPQFARVPKQRKNAKRIMDDLQRIIPKKSENAFLTTFMAYELTVHANVLYGSHFWVATSPTNHRSFITSDNPAGAAFLPLTPNTCLVSSQKKSFPEYEVVDNSTVDFFNKITVKKADRFVYSRERFV